MIYTSKTYVLYTHPTTTPEHKAQIAVEVLEKKKIQNKTQTTTTKRTKKQTNKKPLQNQNKNQTGICFPRKLWIF